MHDSPINLTNWGLCLDISSLRLSAQECLNHEWLKKKPKLVHRIPSMEVTKDNLKQFVERWNEHPNSPYVFEITSHIISPSMLPSGGHSLSGSSQSLLGESPSPCGSLASSAGSDSAFVGTAIGNFQHDLLAPSSADHLRRSSDSAGVMKTNNIAERINLAEEIKKLSDKLFQLSNMNTSLTNNQCPFSPGSPESPKESTIERSVPITITGKRHQNGIPTSIENTGVPWRKPKNKLSVMSRDVPLVVKTIHKPPNDQFTTKTNNSADPSTTKDLLLHLLEHWEGPKIPKMNKRHGSVSTEWTENDVLRQRTISSLNTFFQSRATNKKITPFHFNQS